MAVFGNSEFDQYTFAGGVGVPRVSVGTGFKIIYTIIPQAGQGFLIGYGVQAFRATAFPIYYQVISPITDFSINGVLFPRPTRMKWTFPGEIGLDLSGVPIKQGYMSLEWQYDVMLDTSMAQLLTTYTPASPLVTITYPNEVGYWTRKQAMMQPPDFGSRQTIAHQGVTVKFTHISSD
jgi:hypothetical protein